MRLADIKSREDTAEFLKSQLRLKHLPESAFVDASEKDERLLRKEKREQRKREAEMRSKSAKAAFEAQAIAMEEAQKKAVKVDNENMRILMILAASAV